jgi:hypothetical protein
MPVGACILIHCLALKPVLNATYIVPVQMHFGESEYISKSRLRPFIHAVSQSKVQRWFSNKPVSLTPTCSIQSNRASSLVGLGIRSVHCIIATWRQLTVAQFKPNELGLLTFACLYSQSLTAFITGMSGRRYCHEQESECRLKSVTFVSIPAI